MTPIAAKALVALCICPPAVMTALVATSPPARAHAVKAFRHALRRAPVPASAPAAPAVVSTSPLTGGCENLPRFSSLSVPMEGVNSLTASPLASPLIGASNALPAGLNVSLTSPGGMPSFAPAPPVFNDLLPLSGAPDLGQWLQMMVGFGLLGSTARVRRRSRS